MDAAERELDELDDPEPGLELGLLGDGLDSGLDDDVELGRSNEATSTRMPSSIST